MSREVIRTLELSDPIHDCGKEITQLEFSEPRARHLRVIDSTPGQVGQAVKLIAALCNLSDEAVEELTAKDFGKASEIVANFFEGEDSV